MFDWVDAQNAAEVQANAAIVQAVAAFLALVVTCVLVWLNVRSGRQTTTIATETERLARETAKMVDVSRRQHRAATLPVIVFRLEQTRHAEQAGMLPDLRAFTAEVANAGKGPALDLRIVLDTSSSGLALTENSVAQPFVLAAGESLTLRFRLDEQAPIRLDDTTRSEIVAANELLRRHKELHAQVYNGRPTIPAHEAEQVREAWKGYRDTVWTMAWAIIDVGTLRAEYRDVFGTELASTVPVLHVEFQRERDGETRRGLQLGPMSVAYEVPA